MIENQNQLDNTRAKLELLESLHRDSLTRPMPNERVRELTLFSVKKRINRLKEAIARYQAATARPATKA